MALRNVNHMSRQNSDLSHNLHLQNMQKKALSSRNLIDPLHRPVSRTSSFIGDGKALGREHKHNSFLGSNFLSPTNASNTLGFDRRNTSMTSKDIRAEIKSANISNQNFRERRQAKDLSDLSANNISQALTNQ
jgi:hypothetical protein